MTLLKINKLLPIYTSNLLLKIGLHIRSQTKVKSLKTEKSNMATRWPFSKWHLWKATGFIPYTQVMCYWSLDLIFKAKLKLESGNWKIQYGHQAATALTLLTTWLNCGKRVIWKISNAGSQASYGYHGLELPHHGINRLLPIATKNVHMKFEIEIPEQTWVTLRKPCCLQTDRQTDR